MRITSCATRRSGTYKPIPNHSIDQDHGRDKPIAFPVRPAPFAAIMQPAHRVAAVQVKTTEPASRTVSISLECAATCRVRPSAIHRPRRSGGAEPRFFAGHVSGCVIAIWLKANAGRMQVQRQLSISCTPGARSRRPWIARKWPPGTAPWRPFGSCLEERWRKKGHPSTFRVAAPYLSATGRRIPCTVEYGSHTRVWCCRRTCPAATATHCHQAVREIAPGLGSARLPRLVTRSRDYA
jgi:hypothetical protein